MGLLDEAIREHLDLKRRRGGDPGEIERAEREALGPVRRGPDAPGDNEPGADDELLYEEEEEDESWGEPFDHEQELPPGRGREAELDEEPAARDRAADLHDEEPFPEDEPAEREPRRRASQRPPDHAGEETAEYEVEGALEAEKHEHGDDVLEETPEFLQDTPDHDRLWFEQRPPKDFDFDR
jgi:hypothetical protein